MIGQNSGQIEADHSGEIGEFGNFHDSIFFGRVEKGIGVGQCIDLRSMDSFVLFRFSFDIFVNITVFETQNDARA